MDRGGREDQELDLKMFKLRYLFDNEMEIFRRQKEKDFEFLRDTGTRDNNFTDI